MLQSLKNGATSLAILEGAQVPSCCEGRLTRTVYEAPVTASALTAHHCNFEAEKSTAASCNVPRIAHFDGLTLT